MRVSIKITAADEIKADGRGADAASAAALFKELVTARTAQRSD